MISWQCNTAVFPLTTVILKCHFAAWLQKLFYGTTKDEEKMSLYWRLSHLMPAVLLEISLDNMTFLSNQCPFIEFDESGWETGSLPAGWWKQPVLMMWLPAGMCNFIMFVVTLVQSWQDWVPCCIRCCMTGILAWNLLCHDFFKMDQILHTDFNTKPT